MVTWWWLYKYYLGFHKLPWHQYYLHVAIYFHGCIILSWLHRDMMHHAIRICCKWMYDKFFVFKCLVCLKLDQVVQHDSISFKSCDPIADHFPFISYKYSDRLMPYNIYKISDWMIPIISYKYSEWMIISYNHSDWMTSFFSYWRIFLNIMLWLVLCCPLNLLFPAAPKAQDGRYWNAHVCLSICLSMSVCHILFSHCNSKMYCCMFSKLFRYVHHVRW